MQTQYSEGTHFSAIAAIAAGTWIALRLGLDPGTASALLSLVAIVSAHAGHIAGWSGHVPAPMTVEDVSFALPSCDDPSLGADVFGFDCDLSF